MKTAIPAAVENRPWLALAVIVGVCFYPAAQLTIEEWKDAIDASRTPNGSPNSSSTHGSTGPAPSPSPCMLI